MTTIKDNNILPIYQKESSVSLALARKYRPSTFSDLVGQESVSQTLSQSLDGDRLSHAYLFSGLRGSGKTSTARIFAKALLCEEGQSSHPCNQCNHCIMANENRHMDIIEMDAASNRGIDDIKDLIEHTKYKPSLARYKIFIIDEVHMLTSQAFNALLKTLEEPPPFIKFILATTDPLKLPATILSRTQHFRFKKIPLKLVLQHLEHILNKEGVEYEREALEIISRSGAGSLRDSLTLLDQAIVYSKNHVDIATVTGMLGIIEPSLLDELLDNIIVKDQEKILIFIKLAGDYETEMIIDELTLFLKELLLTKSPKVSPMIIDRFFRVLADAKSLLSIGGDEEFILSLSLFKMMEALEIKDIDMMIKSLERELSGVSVTEAISAPVATPQSSTQEVEKNVTSNVESRETTALSEKSEQTTQKPIEEPITEIKKPTETPHESQDIEMAHNYQRVFDTLVKKIYDRDYDLGVCFEKNITFVEFASHTLTWASRAEDTDREMLRTYWSIIKMFVQELFGVETKIVHIPQAPSPSSDSKNLEKGSRPSKEIAGQSSQETPVEEQAPQESEDGSSAFTEELVSTQECDENTGSMIEDVEMKSSCIMPEADGVEAAKEKEPTNILEEPMIKEITSLFNPKRVTVKRKV